MRKMKAGIVTIHTDFNYGAVLQAVATQKFLELNGVNAEIIDYENKEIAKQFKLFYKQGKTLFGYGVTLVRNVFFGRFFYYKHAIKNLDSYRKKTKIKYITIDDLKNVDYDLLIAGSDQIWNSEITGELDPVFLLDFGQRSKKISLATSMGSHILSDEEKEKFRAVLRQYSAISVREKFAKCQLDKLTSKKVKVLLDPTLLLNKTVWWREFARYSKYANKREKYILTYFVGGDKFKYRKQISEYSNKMHLPVWTIQFSNYQWKESDKKILGASIIDFVALISNAELVITDSFHGVAFSVNMERDFVALTNRENPIRVREFLEAIELDDRIDMSITEYSKINYDKPRILLEDLRCDSEEWIKSVLEEELAKDYNNETYTMDYV